MSGKKLPTDRLDAAIQDVPEEPVNDAEGQHAPPMKPTLGHRAYGEAVKRGRQDDYDNAIAAKYGEGW